MSGYVDLSITTNNFERTQNRLRRFSKNVDDALHQALREYYYDDFKPMLNRTLKGFRARGVPARNASRWASIKSSRYGINHSLGLITGDLHRGAMAVEPRIVKERNRTRLNADFSNVPEGRYPYMEVIHEGLDGLHRPYPMIEATRRMTHKMLLKRVERNTSKAWNKTGG